MSKDKLGILYQKGVLSELDLYFAEFIQRTSKCYDYEIGFASAMASAGRASGHICVELSEICNKKILKEDQGDFQVLIPDAVLLKEKLGQCALVGGPGELKPLIIDDKDRLYLHRYWEYETALAQNIKARVHMQNFEIDEALLKDILNRLFPYDQGTGPDMQKVAAFAAATRNFCVISGGPGTGKTFTIAKILAMLLELEWRKEISVFLAASTGKAAFRLEETIKEVAEKYLKDFSGIQKTSFHATTIHRILGYIYGSPYFRFNQDNQLSADLVVVDEASMVDLALMTKLVWAVPIQARLVLVGDMDQLASVEAGYVFGDICNRKGTKNFSKKFCEDVKRITGQEIGPESQSVEGSETSSDFTIYLKKSHRFDDKSGIGAVAKAVNMGDADYALKLLEKGCEEISWKKLPDEKHLAVELEKNIISNFEDYLVRDRIEDIFKAFNSFRILCAVNFGPYGRDNFNGLIQKLLAKKGLINASSAYYKGRPLIITQNDYDIKLFNGDMGIVLPDAHEDYELKAFFPAEKHCFRSVLHHRLPAHETAFALTVHKSQGSEFNDVLLVLPEQESDVLTRELIYTAITRARNHVWIWSCEKILRFAIERAVKRSSGLRDILWQKVTIQ